LLNLNTSALSSISTTIDGEAEFLERGGEEERWLKEKHLANNTFGDEDGMGEDGMQQQSLFGTSPNEGRGIGLSRVESNGEGEGGRGCFIEGEDVRVVVVRVREGRIADWKGGVKDWAVVEADDGSTSAGAGEGRGRTDGGLVNGV